VHGAIADLPGSTTARQMLVENSLRYLEALSAESSGEPSLQRELATAYEKVGDVQGGFRASNLGDPAGAMKSYHKALAIRETLSGEYPKDRDVKRELLRNYGKLGDMLAYQGAKQAAIDNSRRAARLASELVAEKGATAADRRNLGNVYYSLGWQLSDAGQFGDGLLFLKQAAVVYESIAAEHPDDTLTRRAMSLAYDRMGEVLLEATSRYGEGLQMHTKALEIANRLAAADPHNTGYKKMQGYSLLGIGWAHSKLGSMREALKYQLAAVATFNPVVTADPRNEEARFDTANALFQVGVTYNTLGQWRTAEQQLSQSLALLAGSPTPIEQTPQNTRQLGDRIRAGIATARAGLAQGRSP
jgi:non-specific serine/threonine protein kinase/serine/threonine-protein kinase